jgi:type IV pilus biogenesis protein PilP
VAPGGVSLATLRPATRPDDLGERIERNALGGFSLEELAGRRPQLRPEGLAPPPPDPAIEELLATLPEDAPQEEIIVTDQAVAVSLRPDPRPQNFDRVVAAATPPPTPTPTAPPPSTAPSGPTSQTVAQLATTEDALNLRQVNLIGIYGRPNDRRALVRLSNGRYIKVEAGDSLDGGRVAAISESNLRYEKRGRTITLSMPSG